MLRKAFIPGSPPGTASELARLPALPAAANGAAPMSTLAIAAGVRADGERPSGGVGLLLGRPGSPAAMSTLATATGARAEGERVTGGRGLLLGVPAAASAGEGWSVVVSGSRLRLDLKLLAAVRLDLLGCALGGGLGDAGLPACVSCTA